MDAFLAQITSGNNASWILLGMSVFAVIYLTVRPRKRDPLSIQPFRVNLAQQKALERDMQNVIVELSEMTRQTSSQMETRAAKLDALIREADEKLIALRSLLKEVESRGVSSPADSTIVDAPAKPVRDENPHGEDRWAEVYRLSDLGLALPQIAQQLGRPNGEIELILALRPKARPPADRPPKDDAVPVVGA